MHAQREATEVWVTLEATSKARLITDEQDLMTLSGRQNGCCDLDIWARLGAEGIDRDRFHAPC